MSSIPSYLIHGETRARWMRLDTAQLLKRFFFCERALLVSQAAWIPSVAHLDAKIGLARSLWQSAETANALRNRVFELRFPNRLLEEAGADRALVEFLGGIQNSPSSAAFLSSLGHVLLPALRDSYREYLDGSDPIADGPTHRFLSLALTEKEEQIRFFRRFAAEELAMHAAQGTEVEQWTKAVSDRLGLIGGIGVGGVPSEISSAPIPGEVLHSIPSRPARDPRFLPCRFYWPDIVDPDYSYGEGVRLQLRSAISHLNEVWAIEAGGIMLSSFANQLPWEWIYDSARWTYDESRHCRMGYERLMAWNFEPADIPLGTYIYESASGHDPLYRLGMLYFFETKNIRHKPARTQLFHGYGDKLSEHDMDFDWADETLHASYGKHWLKELLKVRGEDPESHDRVRQKCSELVSQFVQTATADEISEIKDAAGNLVSKAGSRLLR